MWNLLYIWQKRRQLKGGMEFMISASRAQGISLNPKKENTMNKAGLVAAIAEETGSTKKASEDFLNAFIDTVVASVAKGEKVSVVGFGSYERKRREARKGRNPKTGDPIDIPAKEYPAFSAGKAFKDQVA